MRPDLYDRRKEMLKYHSRGLPFRLWSKELAGKYGVSYEAVRRDWFRREKWLPKIVKLDNVSELINDLLMNLDQTREAAWRVFHESGNPNAQIGALKHIAEVARSQIEILQSIGKLERAPERFESEVTVKKSQEFDMRKFTDDEREAMRNVARIMEQRNRESSSEAG